MNEPGYPSGPAPIGFVDGRFVDPGRTSLLIAVLTCEKYLVRANGIRSSWLRLLPSNYQVLFVHGRPGREAGIEGDCLYLDCPESYEMLPRKVHELLGYCLSNLEFDYLFKTDDDTYLDLERFIAFDKEGADYIGQFREQPVAEIGKTWHFGKCTDKTFEVPYDRPFVCPWATGGGYFLSRNAAKIAFDKTQHSFSGSLFEDMMVGEALTRHPGLKVLLSRFATMGVINPLLPKDMLYVQDLVLERRRLSDEVLALREENRLLKADPVHLVGKEDGR